LQSLQSGALDSALSQLKERVRSDPASSHARIFLFQLFAVSGDWNRALAQLNVAGELDDAALAMVQTYREALSCEVLRSGVFAGKYSPLVFGEPDAWIAELIEALKLVSDGQYLQAQALSQRAFEQAPATRGEIDGESFSWIADADSRLGPVLETIINGRYYWVPFNRIARIQLEAPCDLRDIVWMPACFTWVNGGESVGLIPTRYPGAERSTDPQIKLSKKTDWLACSAECYQGQGQRLLVTDMGEFPLMDVREITLHSAGFA